MIPLCVCASVCPWNIYFSFILSYYDHLSTKICIFFSFSLITVHTSNKKNNNHRQKFMHSRVSKFKLYEIIRLNAFLFWLFFSPFFFFTTTSFNFCENQTLTILNKEPHMWVSLTYKTEIRAIKHKLMIIKNRWIWLIWYDLVYTKQNHHKLSHRAQKKRSTIK